MRSSKRIRAVAALIRIIAFLQIHPPAAAAAPLGGHVDMVTVADTASDRNPVRAGLPAR
jgi:hypothetical protein